MMTTELSRDASDLNPYCFSPSPPVPPCRHPRVPWLQLQAQQNNVPPVEDEVPPSSDSFGHDDDASLRDKVGRPD